MSYAIRAIKLTLWGVAMTEGMVAYWHVEAGATVAEGDELLEIETSKITNVFEAPGGGVLRRRLVGEGETVAVQALLAVVAPPEISDADIDAFIETYTAEFEAAAAAAAEEGAGPEPEFVEAGGRRLCFLKMGDGDRPPIVMLHGFGGDLNNWMFNQPMLAAERTTYALDLPGHGQSAKEVGGGTVDALTLSVIAWMEAVEVDRAHLVGHSMGGAVALNLALNEPHRVASLTLVAPAALGPEINNDYIAGFLGAARRKEMKPLLQQLFADPELVSRDMVNDILKFKRLDGVDAALGTLAEGVFPGGAQALLLRDRLDAVEAPIQVIWGAQDRILPPAHADGLPPKIGVYVLENAGHMPHMEQATEVNALIGKIAAG